MSENQYYKIEITPYIPPLYSGALLTEKVSYLFDEINPGHSFNFQKKVLTLQKGESFLGIILNNTPIEGRRGYEKRFYRCVKIYIHGN